MKLTIALLLTTLSTAAAAACERSFPDAPSIPDGRVASQAEMYQAQEAVKSFVDTGVAYLNCRKHLNFMNFNRKVRSLEGVAEAYNQQLTIFQDRPDQVATK